MIKNSFNQKTKKSLPVGWPKDIPLPALEETRKAVREGEQMIADMLDNLKDKVTGPTPEMLKTIVFC